MTTLCSYCHQPSPLLFQAQDNNRRISNSWFTYFCCSKCNLIFLDPVPKDITLYYPQEYYNLPTTVKKLANNAKRESYKIEYVKAFLKSGKILEIGPGGCGFAYLAKKEGFYIETLEMDPYVSAFLNNVVKIPTYNANNLSVILQKPQYDMIVLWHVIEHVPKPFEMLKEISQLLLPGGFVIIAAPNPTSLQFKIFKKLWAHLDAPRHLFLIPQDLLSNCMADLAFTTVLNTTHDAGSSRFNNFGWQKSMSNQMKTKLGKIVTSVIGRITSISAKPIENKEGKGSCYTMVFQKRAQ